MIPKPGLGPTGIPSRLPLGPYFWALKGSLCQVSPAPNTARALGLWTHCSLGAPGGRPSPEGRDTTQGAPASSLQQDYCVGASAQAGDKKHKHWVRNALPSGDR